jgi:hypothetical protein
MGRNIFSSRFCDDIKFKIENVTFDASNNVGTCQLVSDKKNYIMIWKITDYPSVNPIPGALVPYLVELNIFDEYPSCYYKSLKSISGKFVYEVNSGTLPIYSPLGIPYGNYINLLTNNYNGNTLNGILYLDQNCLEFNIFK